MYASTELWLDGAPWRVSEAEVRAAMLRLRFSNPFFAVRWVDTPSAAEGGGVIVYDPHDVDAWLDSSLVVHRDPWDADRFIARQTMPDHAGTLRAKVHLFIPPESRSRGQPVVLVLEQSHNYADGVGTFVVLDELLSALAACTRGSGALAWGEEVARLPPSLMDADGTCTEAGWAMSKSERRAARLESIAQVSGRAGPPSIVDKASYAVALAAPVRPVARAIARSGAALPLGLLAVRKAPHAPATYTRVLSHILTPAQTAALVARARATGTGVTLAPLVEAAMLAALMWVRTARALKSAPNRVMGSLANAICRRSALNLPRYPGVCFSAMPTRVSAHQVLQAWQHSPLPTGDADVLPTATPDLTDLACSLAQQYTAGRAQTGWLRASKPALERTKRTELALLNQQAYPSNPWLSSIGRIDTIVAPSRPCASAPGSHLHTRNVRIVGRMATRQPILHTYTTADQLVVQSSFAAWIYDDPEAFAPNRSTSAVQFWFDTLITILHRLADQTS